jgi:hypothetical protein
MKIGVWNRLAIVATVLALIVLPAWFIVSANIDFAEAHEQGFQRCAERASQPNDGTLTYKACREIWPIGGQSSYGWEEWREAVVATFIACIVLYGLIWLTVWVAKWVWRGRPDQKDK